VAPVANNDTASPILEDVATPTNIPVLANDTDSNLNPATVSITSPATLGTATAQANGTINYLPSPNSDGSDNFTYQVCDTGGLCDTATVTISVTAVNDQPTFTSGPDIIVNAADPPYTQVNWATGITAGPANEVGQTCAFTVTSSDPSLFAVQPSLSPTGTLTFTLSGTTGVATITIQLIDDGGTAGGGSDTSTQTFTVTVN
jgi:hypothetical protein